MVARLRRPPTPIAGSRARRCRAFGSRTRRRRCWYEGRGSWGSVRPVRPEYPNDAEAGLSTKTRATSSSPEGGAIDIQRSVNDGGVWSRVRPRGTNVSTDRRSRVPLGLESGHPSGHVARSVAQCDAVPTHTGTRKPRCHRGFQVARPGLEPGTPRFSVRCTRIPIRPEIPAHKRVAVGGASGSKVRKLHEMVGDVGHVDAARGPIDSLASWPASGHEGARSRR
jgi:hypothetical protein